MTKHCVPKVLLEIWQVFLHENNCNYNYRLTTDITTATDITTDLVTNSLLFIFCALSLSLS